MPSNPLDLLWLSAGAESPVFAKAQLDELPEDFRNFLTGHKLLKQAQPAKSVECPGCEEGHVEEVQHLVLPDDQRKFYIHCPESGCVQIESHQLLQWAPDYNVLANFLHNKIGCKGEVRALISGKLWSLGRAALAGQSREVFLTRYICDDVKHKLPTGKQPILFIVFPYHNQSVPFEPERTFQLSHLLTMDGDQIHFNIEAVKMQIGYIAETQTPTPKAPRKDAKRAAVIKAAKKELHSHILSMKSLLANGDPKLPRLTQKQLAKRINASRTMVSNILTKEPDELLTILWRTANDPELIRKYSRKRG